MEVCPDAGRGGAETTPTGSLLGRLTDPGARHPVVQVLWAVLLVVVSVAGVAVTADALALGSLDGVEADTVVAVVAAGLLAVLGDVLPVVQRLRIVPGVVVRWSPAFVIAIMGVVGPLPTLVFGVTGALALGIGLRTPVVRLVADVCQVVVAALAMTWVLHLLGWQASLNDPWRPTSYLDLGILCIGMIGALAANDVVITTSVWARTGQDLRTQVPSMWRDYLEAGSGSWLAMTPVIVLTMTYLPEMTILMAVPVAAVHLALAAEHRRAVSAAHDDLTNLTNRREFVRQVDAALAADPPPRAALLVVDLDGFKQINDELGHPVGDQILVEVAHRLRGAVRSADVVARLGGDEFGVFAHTTETDDVRALARRIHAHVRGPAVIDGHDVEIGASVGAAAVGADGQDFDTLYDNADAAMFSMKAHRSGSGLYGDSDVRDEGSRSRCGS